MFAQLFNQIRNQLIPIPIENNLGWFYVVLNLVASLIAPFFDTLFPEQ